MNNNAKLWVEALRSGEYEQGSGWLQDGNRYCCLGVACIVYEKQTEAILSRDDDGVLNSCQYLGNDYCEVKQWLGLRDSVGGFHRDSNLASLNDEGKTFGEIADVIESEPEGLFV